MQPSQLVKIRQSLENRPLSFEQCIEWARLKFQEEYNNDIQQLLYSLPRDMVCQFVLALHGYVCVSSDMITLCRSRTQEHPSGLVQSAHPSP